MGKTSELSAYKYYLNIVADTLNHLNVQQKDFPKLVDVKRQFNEFYNDYSKEYWHFPSFRKWMQACTDSSIVEDLY